MLGIARVVEGIGRRKNVLVDAPAEQVVIRHAGDLRRGEQPAAGQDDGGVWVERLVGRNVKEPRDLAAGAVVTRLV
jgi:hypothetical protein